MPPISVTIFASDPGTYYLEDDGIPGNNFSSIRFPDGSVVSFEHPTDDLFFDPSVPGVTLVVNLTDSLGTSRFTAGDLTDPASTPTSILVNRIHTNAGVTLVATGAILESGIDAGADIVASTLILSAGTGVGTAANALETQVGALEAETSTGGITLSNAGSVAIGGLTALVNGLDVATSGNLSFTTLGSLLLSDASGSQTVHGGATSGNVTLSAIGPDTDVLANVDLDSIVAPGGNVVVAAGRDIGFGLIGSNFDNDVRARGSITLNPGRDLLLDGFADIVSDSFGANTGGNVIVNAGRNITLLAVAGTDAGLTASGAAGADVILTTGPGGSFTANSGNGTAPFASAISESGDVIVNADRISIGTNGALSSVAGQVVLRPATLGWAVDLGSASDAAFALELSDAELDRIFASNLTVGSDTAGDLRVSAFVGVLNAANLTLRSEEDITLLGSLTTTTSIALRAGNNLFQQAGTISTGAFTALVDTIAGDGGVGGIATLNGSIFVASSTANGNAEADTLNGSGVGEFLNGFDGNDTLRGFGGNDTLNGGTGIDTAIGGIGDDSYYVDNTADVVIESVGEGNTDRVYASVSYTLLPGSEVERLSTTNNAGTGAINLTGNEIANIIYGNAGANSLNGKGGADMLIGLGGNDFYYLDNAADTVSEGAADGANDRIFASLSYTLASGVYVETLTTDNNGGVAAINLTGNEIANTIVGNAGVNILDGKAGIDSMAGLGGNDWYIVDNAADSVSEGAAEGADDRVFASASYTLGAGVYVERLSTTNDAGAALINLSGNELVNIITGNAAANTLDGKGGVDTMIGLGGDDWYYVDSALDVVTEGAGAGAADRIFASVSYTMAAGVYVEQLSTTNSAGLTALNFAGNELANIITGNAGANLLDGRGGNDTLAGLGGADIYRFTITPGAGNVDAISGFSVADDVIHLENAVFTGLAAGALAAGAFNTGAAATQADDRIIYNSVTGGLLFDVDGVGGAAAVPFAGLAAGLAITAADFFVI